MWHIAVDIGASSGRMFAGRIIEGWGTGVKRCLETIEIHRFDNPIIAKAGNLFWDVDRLFECVLEGLQRARARGILRATLGIDTWGVDYVLLDGKGERIGEAYCYRDDRCLPAMRKYLDRYPKISLYSKTGIQFLPFNTLFQLAAHDRGEKERTATVLLIPDYLNFRLTGVLANEATNASTTQLMNYDTRDFDLELLESVGLKREQFARIAEPGEFLGMIEDGLLKRYELPDCEVYTVASHDTASAVIGTPLKNHYESYISAGTWSLMGLELASPILNERAFAGNFTNEFGAGKSYRFLKNMTGLWILQGIVASFGLKDRGDAALAEAEHHRPFECVIDVNSKIFMNPQDMAQAIARYCETSGQNVPLTPVDFVRVAIDSMALAFRMTLEELQSASAIGIERARMVGGGSRIPFFCKRAAEVMDLEILAGPMEATTLGNIAMQVVASGEALCIDEVREIIECSCDIKRYVPEKSDDGIGRALERLSEARERCASLYE